METKNIQNISDLKFRYCEGIDLYSNGKLIIGILFKTYVPGSKYITVVFYQETITSIVVIEKINYKAS